MQVFVILFSVTEINYNINYFLISQQLCRVITKLFLISTKTLFNEALRLAYKVLLGSKMLLRKNCIGNLSKDRADLEKSKCTLIVFSSC